MVKFGMQSPLEKKLIAHRFNQAAQTYDTAAFVQQEVGLRLAERLDDVKLQPEHIIDLGCGSGRNLPKLMARYPQAQIMGVDFAPAMLAQSRHHSKLMHIAADAAHLPFADNSVDLIFSNLMLQWCDPLAPVFAECYRVLREGGLLLFSTFGPDTLQELRYCWAQIDSFPHVNVFIDMHPIGDMLLQQRFADPVMDVEYITASYKNVTNIMRDLQDIGATNTHSQRRKTLTGKNRLSQLSYHYQQFSLPDQRLPVTYEIVYGLAWKLAPVEASSTTSYISLEDIGNRKKTKF